MIFDEMKMRAQVVMLVSEVARKAKRSVICCMEQTVYCNIWENMVPLLMKYHN